MPLYLIELKGTPILDQLLLEERLLRTETRNFCLLNFGSPPAIVMGISGNPEQLIHLDRVDIPIIKRFSGGGTVVIDEETLFVTFIMNKARLPVPSDPKAIMKWSEGIYKPLFPNLQLQENDYVFGRRKFGGNAQYIRKERWLHHTSFLWDYQPSRMNLLKLPEKAPVYREGRNHTDFLCTIKDLFSSKPDFRNALKKALEAHFEIVPTALEELGPAPEFRQATVKL